MMVLEGTGKLLDIPIMHCGQKNFQNAANLGSGSEISDWEPGPGFEKAGFGF